MGRGRSGSVNTHVGPNQPVLALTRVQSQLIANIAAKKGQPQAKRMSEAACEASEKFAAYLGTKLR